MSTPGLILKTIGDWFLNFNGDGDVKLFLGFAFAIFGGFYIAMIKPGDVAGFIAIEGTAGTFLGLGVVQDKVNAGSPPAGTPPATP